MKTCDDCGGEGGFYSAAESYGHKYADPTPCERWDDCPVCHGSGWVDEPAPQLTQDDLEERVADVEDYRVLR